MSDSVLAITVNGALDEVADPVIAERTRHHLHSPLLDTLVLDLTGVTEVSTRGAVALLECAQRARMHDVALYLVPGPAASVTLQQLDVRDRFVTVPTARHAPVINDG